ncbi:hypothetical protein WOLCODRAFT_21979 [Wolfiporia cocos MD-104 SS10]|uniref:RING-type domain-containing protein n=1 Tax=Wolfiporia cocos (strain MD-104) TaxID=742152 RepID=A0A2H3J3S3_WOLCO|nr:hypothetical protein WOLCODRAFT_21979 [Wolfiporia cocos MD-104 SS10]
MADPDPHVGIRQVLAEYEEDLSCPICCDIVAAAYMSNPCGHTFCGNCAWVWVSKNRRTPTCAVCRANLVPSSPLIPNIAIDHTVEKHISALVQSGSEDWLPEGAAFTEWMRRKESGKSVVSNHLANCR